MQTHLQARSCIVRRLLRSADLLPLRHGVVAEDCPPQDALAAWATSQCCTAAAMHLEATDPNAAGHVSDAVAALYDIAGGRAGCGCMWLCTYKCKGAVSLSGWGIACHGQVGKVYEREGT